jgi:predicted nucleic acid-binding protein
MSSSERVFARHQCCLDAFAIPCRGLGTIPRLAGAHGWRGQDFLSVVTIHEIEKGIALLEHKGAAAKAGALRVWLSGLVATYDDKILGADISAAALAGQLEAKAISAGHDPGMADATVAGIAKANDLIVVTLNTKHFVPFGVSVASPDDPAGSA